MSLVVLLAVIFRLFGSTVYAHCGKCKADGSGVNKSTRQVRQDRLL